MKLLVYSDLHNEFAVFEGPKIDLGDVDGVVLCGDTDLGTKGAAWALRTFKKIPVLYVAGNHEYYIKAARKPKCFSVGMNGRM